MGGLDVMSFVTCHLTPDPVPTGTVHVLMGAATVWRASSMQALQSILNACSASLGHMAA